MKNLFVLRFTFCFFFFLLICFIQQQQQKVLDLLLKTTLDEQASTRRNQVTSSRSKWRMQKKLDLVDSLLDREMREQDHEWANYEVEEQESRMLLTNMIFEMVLKDTLDSFQICLVKKNAIN